MDFILVHWRIYNSTECLSVATTSKITVLQQAEILRITMMLIKWGTADYWVCWIWKWDLIMWEIRLLPISMTCLRLELMVSTRIMSSWHFTLTRHTFSISSFKDFAMHAEPMKFVGWTLHHIDWNPYCNALRNEICWSWELCCFW